MAIPLPERRCGYLLKLGHYFPKMWKTRFFVLEEGQLSYFTTETAPGSGIGSNMVSHPIVLRGFTVSEPGQGRILISNGEARTLVLRFKEMSAFKIWLESIHAHVAYLRAKDEQRMLAMPDPTVVPLVHVGYMTKQGQINKTWKRRFFRLERGELSYFVSDVDGVGKDRMGEPIVLFGYEVSIPSRGTLLLNSKLHAGRKMFLRVAEEEVQEWADALLAHVRYLNVLPLLAADANAEQADEADDVAS